MAKINLKGKKIGNNFTTLPTSPGVYIFKKNNKPIYVGKAINLKSRLLSYKRLNLGSKTKAMVVAADSFSYILTFSEFESLLLEAELIKKYKPKYNILLKDDKSPVYISISKDHYPKVTITRNKGNFGPYLSSKTVSYILRTLRKIIPFSDHNLGKKPCLYSQIGLCSPCPNYINIQTDLKLKSRLRKEYLANISLLKKVLKRKFSFVRVSLTRKMEVLSKLQAYEEALKVKKSIEALDYITNVFVTPSWYINNPNLTSDIYKMQATAIRKAISPYVAIKKLKRIECYDISHLAGSMPAASMVTFINGLPDKSLYRQFRIKQPKKASDFDSMKEVAKRRSLHLNDWGKPDLIVVDGGKAQIKAFSKYMKPYKIEVVGIIKNPDRLVVDDLIVKIKSNNALNLLTFMRNEAHRFAQRYHNHLVKSSYLT